MDNKTKQKSAREYGLLNSPVVKSLWENIVLQAGTDGKNTVQKLCLENIIKLYLRVRSFLYARDYISQYKIREKMTVNH